MFNRIDLQKFVNNASSHDSPAKTQSRFWVGPLVAGCCFALGYGIAERVLTLQTNAQDPVPEAFTPLAFPGDSLQEIRARFSDEDPSLQVDVSALEAASRPAQPAAKPAVKETPKPDVALQTPEPPVWTSPAWSDPQAIEPDLEPALLPEASEADGSEPFPVGVMDDGNAIDPLMFPDVSSDNLPAVVVPDGDSPVLVAEPEPAVLPPGAEAFFETIELVTPPQP